MGDNAIHIESIGLKENETRVLHSLARVTKSRVRLYVIREPGIVDDADIIMAA